MERAFVVAVAFVLFAGMGAALPSNPVVSESFESCPDTCSGNYSIVYSVNGSGFYFNDASAAIEDMGFSTSLQGGDAKTWSFWIKTDTLDDLLADKNVDNGYLIQIGRRSADKMEWGAEHSGNWHEYYGSTTIKNGELYHVVVVKNAQKTGTNTIEFWINGTQDSTTIYREEAGTWSDLDDSDPAVFADHSGSGASNSYTGLLDEFRMYDRALTSNEINELYTETPDNQTFSVTASPSTWQLTNTINATANFTRSNANLSTVEYEVEENGTTIRTGNLTQNTTASELWHGTDLFTVDKRDVWYNLTVEATDDSGATDTATLNQYINDQSPTVQIKSPSGNYTGSIIPYNFSVDDSSDDIPDETLECEVSVNGGSVANYTGSESYTASDNLTTYQAQSNTFAVNCADPDGDSTSLSQSFYIWHGINLSAVDNDTGTDIQDWILEVSNTTQTAAFKDLTNPVLKQHTAIPAGAVNITASDGSNLKYYFNTTIQRTVNNTSYIETNISLTLKPDHPLDLTASPSWTLDSGTEITVTGTPQEGTGTLTVDKRKVSNPYTATLDYGFYDVNYSIGETQNYAPNWVSNTINIQSAGIGCTDNTTFAFRTSISPNSNPVQLDFSQFEESDAVRSNLGDVYVPADNISVQRDGKRLVIDTSNYDPSSFNVSWGNYYANQTYTTTSSSAPVRWMHNRSYQEANPYYSFTYNLEKSGQVALPPGGNTTSSMLCAGGATTFRVHDPTILVASQDQLDEYLTTVRYSSTDIYQRNLLISSDVEYRTVWLVDANNHQIVETLLELRDNTGQFTDSYVKVQKQIDGGLRPITEQYFDAEDKTVAYLINGEKYSLYVYNEQGEVRSIGNLYVDTVDLTKTIRINSLSNIDLTRQNLTYSLYRSGNTIEFQFSDGSGNVSEAVLTVWNYSQQQGIGTQIYQAQVNDSQQGSLSFQMPNSNWTYKAQYQLKTEFFGEIAGSSLFQYNQTQLPAFTAIDNRLNDDDVALWAFMAIFITPMFFSARFAKFGSLMQILLAAFLNSQGLISFGTAAASSTAVVAFAFVIIALKTFGDSEVQGQPV